MANNKTQEVNIRVAHIEKGFKDQTAYIRIVFDGNPTEYSYIRKYNIDENENYFSIVSGCRVTFNHNFELIAITREYDVAGKIKISTAKQVGSTKEVKKPVTVAPTVNPVIPTKKTDGEIRHEAYQDIRDCIEQNIPVYLAGPAGSGKSHVVEQIAKDLGWNFYFSNSIQQEFKLTGFIDAGGKYHETEFYKACIDSNDCVFFIDEMDASIPEVLTLLNTAIANGYHEFPVGKVMLDHVHFVAAGNTMGSGADDLYTGRLVLDQATLDRFAMIEFDYSKKIEMVISNQNKDLVDFVHQLRKEATEKGIRATFSYRCITMVTKLETTSMNLNTIMKIAVMKGLDKDTIKTFNVYGYTKYHEALKELQK